MASKSEKKYGISETESVRNFHKGRRMFCIRNGCLYIARPNLPYSHYTWFDNKGWIIDGDDGVMNELVRGMVDLSGDVYFYKGYDFDVDSEVESIFFSHLGELVGRLDLGSDVKIFGGMIKQRGRKKWFPRKSFGDVGSRL